MEKMRKVTRTEINKEKMVALSYCQCQTILDMFGYEYKIGYNSGVYGWNYDLYRINGVDVVTGYNVPYSQYSDKKLKNKLIELENKARQTEWTEQRNKLKEEFFDIFE